MKIEILELADVLNNTDLKTGSFKEAIDLIELIMNSDFENNECSLSYLMCSDALSTSSKYLLFAKIPYSYYTSKRRAPITLNFVKDICKFGIENNLISEQEFNKNLLSSNEISMLYYWLGVLVSQVEASHFAKCMDW